MLQILIIDSKEKYLSKKRRFSFFSINRLRVSQFCEHNIPVKLIHYTSPRDTVNWRRIYRCLDQKSVLLYSCSTPLPNEFRTMVFEPSDFRLRMCINMFIEVLSLMEKVPSNLSIGIYDPLGEYTDVAEYLLRFSDKVLAVTFNKDIYSREARRILWETGAVLRVSKNVSALSECGFILALRPFSEYFTPMTKAVVLTIGDNARGLACRVYNKYDFRLPEEFLSFCPEGIEKDYPIGVLYSLYGFHSLGSLVPYMATGVSDVQTCTSLRSYFYEFFGT